MLSCEALTIRFGGLAAVDSIDFKVSAGEIRGLIGPNGSGKTTLFNLISGIYKPTSGNILFEGKSIAGCRPDQVTQAGIARTFQNIRLFGDMTVWENLQVGPSLPDEAECICRHAFYRGQAERRNRGGHQTGRASAIVQNGTVCGMNWPRIFPTGCSVSWKSCGLWHPTQDCCCLMNRQPV